jgi:hypothetical protein
MLSGLGRAFYTRRTNRLDLVHFAWTVTTFLLMVLNWWIILLWEDFDAWNFPTFLLMVIWVTSFYAMAVALYPTRLREGISYRELFENNRTWFLVTFSIMCLLDITVTIVREGGLPDFQYLLFVGHYAVLGAVAIFVRQRWFDLAVAYWVAFSLLTWAIGVRYML